MKKWIEFEDKLEEDALAKKHEAKKQKWVEIGRAIRETGNPVPVLNASANATADVAVAGAVEAINQEVLKADILKEVDQKIETLDSKIEAALEN